MAEQPACVTVAAATAGLFPATNPLRKIQKNSLKVKIWRPLDKDDFVFHGCSGQVFGCLARVMETFEMFSGVSTRQEALRL